jgi:chromate transporter
VDGGLHRPAQDDRAELALKLLPATAKRVATPNDAAPAIGPRESRTNTLRELALLFLQLGVTAFGGPAAHIAMMEDEVVRRRRWLTHDEFLDLLGATNLIPGPNSTEMAIHIGHRRAGWTGLVVAGSCFILPAALIVLAMAWVYVRFKALPQADALLYGVKPVIIVVVLQALWGLARTAVKSPFLAGVGVAAAVASFCGVNEIALLFAAGALLAAVEQIGRGRTVATSLVLGASLPAAEAAVSVAASFSLTGLFFVFAKIGAVLFGSGYVLLAFLRADLVEHLHWMTEGQLLDAVAVGQITPGPVFTTATFIGYVLGGVPGAGVATVGIFLPAFVFVAASGPLVPRLRRSKTAGAFLDGVNVASLALMAVVTWYLARAAIIDISTVGLALVSAILLFRYGVNSAWLVLAGGIAGLALGVGR